MAMRGLMGEQKARHRVDQGAREHIRADQRENDRLRHRAKEIAGDAAEA